MTEINFYVLANQAALNRFQLSCRIIEKALLNKNRVFIHTSNMIQARFMDDLLWRFKETSFIPHGILGQVDSTQNFVLIGCGSDAGQESDVLINLDTKIPAFFNQFKRLIVPLDIENKNEGRAHYRFFLDRGYNLKTYKLN